MRPRGSLNVAATALHSLPRSRRPESDTNYNLTLPYIQIVYHIYYTIDFLSFLSRKRAREEKARGENSCKNHIMLLMSSEYAIIVRQEERERQPRMAQGVDR